MKKFKRFLVFLLAIIILLIGILVGYGRRGDIFKMTLDNSLLKKVTDFVENLGKNPRSTSYTEMPNITSSSADTTKKTSQSSSSNTTKPYSNETVKVTRDGKTYTLRKDFKAAMDSYENIFDNYARALKSKNSADYMTNYISFMSEYTKFGSEMDHVSEDLTDDEEAYLLIITLKIEKLLLSET